MTKTLAQIQELFAGTDWKKDQGLEPATSTLSDAERRFTALHMGIIAAFIQMAKEGVFPVDQHAHFMMHLQDFVARLYEGQGIDLHIPGFSVSGHRDAKRGDEQTQTFAVDSALGNLFQDVGNYLIVNGKLNIPTETTGINEAPEQEGPSFDEDFTNNAQFQNIGKRSVN